MDLLYVTFAFLCNCLKMEEELEIQEYCFKQEFLLITPLYNHSSQTGQKEGDKVIIVPPIGCQ